MTKNSGRDPDVRELGSAATAIYSGSMTQILQKNSVDPDGLQAGHPKPFNPSLSFPNPNNNASAALLNLSMNLDKNNLSSLIVLNLIVTYND